MNRPLMLSLFAGAALALSLLEPGFAADLRGFAGGTCYADAVRGCKPLRAASKVHVTYGPALPIYSPERVYVVDQGPHPVPSAEAEPVAFYRPYPGHAAVGYSSGFVLGGGSGRAYRHHRHGHWGGHGFHRHAGYVNVRRPAARAIHAGPAPRPMPGARAARGRR